MRYPRIRPISRRVPAPCLGLVLLALLGALGHSATVGHAQEAPQDSCPADGKLFDNTCVHDFFFSFAQSDWESELGRTEEPNNVHADLVYGGEVYKDVGLRFKGLSSARVQGRKKPLNLTMDAFVPGQRLLGYDSLNLNNGFADPSGIREILTYGALRSHVPTPKAAFARVHINGTYFGQYLLVQQIERTFVRDWFQSAGGLLFKADAPAGFGPRALAAAARLAEASRADRITEGVAGLPTGVVGATDPSVQGMAASGHRTDPAADPATPQQGGAGFGLRSNLVWLGEDLAPYRQNYELKTTAAGDAGYVALRELIRVLDAPISSGGVNDAGFPAAIEQVLDVDRALWYFASNNLFMNFDSYYFGHNYYLYRSPGDQRFHMLMWDTNMSFGAFNIPGAAPGGGSTGGMAAADPLHMSTDTSRPLLRRLLAVPRYKADYLAHFRALAEATFAPDALAEAATAHHNLVKDAVETDPNKLYGFDLFLQNLTADVTPPGGRGQARAVPGVLQLARARSDWLAAAPLLAAPDHHLVQQSQDPAEPAQTDTVKVAIELGGTDEPTGVELVYQVDAGFPVTLALTREGDIWSGEIPPQPASAKVTYYARAAFADGRAAFHPAGNLLDPWSYRVKPPELPVTLGGDLVINEIMADNARTVADETSEYGDWIELYNRGSESIALGDTFLGTDPTRPWAFRLPELTLAAGAYLLVWCDEDLFKGARHADFRLSRGGETILLSTRDAIVDQVSYPALITEQSYGRRTDGSGTWDLCGRASPRAANACTGAVVPTVTPGTGGKTFGKAYLPALVK